ncbi:hypothetical protein INR49_028404 [Caranx melampygus]|nr:hypothetical protein INR49_028404 [Caranx melampygus]
MAGTSWLMASESVERTRRMWTEERSSFCVEVECFSDAVKCSLTRTGSPPGLLGNITLREERYWHIWSESKKIMSDSCLACSSSNLTNSENHRVAEADEERIGRCRCGAFGVKSLETDKQLPTFPPFAAPGSVGGSATLQTGKVCGVADNTLQAHESQLLAVERKIQDLEEEAVEEIQLTQKTAFAVSPVSHVFNKSVGVLIIAVHRAVSSCPPSPSHQMRQEEEESTLGVIPGVEKTNFGLNKGRQRELSDIVQFLLG